MLTFNYIGREIASRRKAARWTQAELAQKASISRPTLDALENGRTSELGFAKIIRVLAALGLDLKLQEANQQRPTLDDLLNEEDDNDQGLDRRS